MKRFLAQVNCLGALAALTSLAAGTERDLAFTHHFIDTELPVNEQGYGDYGATALVDLDRDGDLDFVIGGRAVTPSTLYWYEFESADRWVRHVVGTQYLSDVGLAALDVDRDGWTDLVGSGVWFRNPGVPRTQPFDRIEFAPNDTGAHDVLVADLNKDGRPDVVLMGDERTKLNALCWYSIPADPRTRWDRHAVASPVHGAITPKGAVDIDHDGDLDLVRADTWFENADGQGTRWLNHPNLPMGRKGPFGVCVRVVAVDLDGDGGEEILLADADIEDCKLVI
ncbi:MAG: VCBS repeat-containing protein [Verrucomicrobiota bacterium]